MPASPAPILYLKVAQNLEELIRTGAWRIGDKLPSVRQCSQQQGVSISTVLQAYGVLEDKGLIKPRAKSGYYVNADRALKLKVPKASTPPSAVTAISVGGLQSRLFAAARLPGILSLGGAAPSPDLLPTTKLNRILASLCRSAGRKGVSYNVPPGDDALRREIARRSLDAGCHLQPDQIITTCGGTEALLLCLRAVTKPGDVVAVESPTYFGVLHAMEELHLKAIEIPMDASTGMVLDTLERILKTQKLAACVSVPNFNNPLGSLMPDENKEKLVRLLRAHDVPLIEDDIFGELHYGPTRPRTALSFDTQQQVMLCSSFSKTLAPGYRIGWVVPGRHRERIQTLKLASTLANATLPELAVAEFLATGGYDHYLRHVRQVYAMNVQRVSDCIARHFPSPVKVTRPEGGFVLWVELPHQVDSLRLDDLALAEGISIAPGPMFSATRRFRNYIRLSCAIPWTPAVESGIATMGRLAASLMKK